MLFQFLVLVNLSTSDYLEGIPPEAQCKNTLLSSEGQRYFSPIVTII